MFTKTDIEKYFMAEKQAGLLFLVIGILAILIAVVFFFLLKTNFYKGAAVPLLVLGLIEAAVGFAVYKRSDADRIRNVYAYDMNPQELRDKELPRMQKVNANFTIYRWAEIIFAVGGIVLLFLFRSNPEKTFWYGLGITLTIQALLLFAADTNAEKRAKEYRGKLSAFLAVKPM